MRRAPTAALALAAAVTTPLAGQVPGAAAPKVTGSIQTRVESYDDSALFKLRRQSVALQAGIQARF